MKKKIKMALPVLSLAWSVMLSGAVLSGSPAQIFLNRAGAAEAEQSATHILTTAQYGPDWESTPFGKNGWVVFEAEGQTSNTENEPKTVYSDLYTNNKNYDAQTQSIELTGRTKDSGNSWVMTEDGKTTDAAESLETGIDKWAFCGRAWREASVESLYIPGTRTPVRARMDGWNTKWQDTSIVISKTGPEPLYVTTYVFATDSSKVLPEAPLEFRVFSGASLAPNNGEDLFSHYGKLLTGTKVTVSGSYVTFCLEGEGEFQIVATKGVDETGNVIGTQAPYLGGFFLDNEKPPVIVENARHVLTTDAYGSDWESSPFGTSGWVLLGAEGQTSSTENEPKTVYSDLYVNNKDYDAQTQSIELTGRTNNDDNTWLTTNDGKGTDPLPGTDPGIGKWAFTGRAWREMFDPNIDYLFQSLYVPGTKTPIKARLDGWGSSDGIEDTSIALEKITEEPLYVTVYLYSGNYTKITPESPVDFYVYYGANLTKNSEGTLDHYGRELIGKTTVTSGRSYVTFLLEGKGEFQIVATKGTNENGEVIGITAPYLGGFFLDSALYPVPETMNISLEGDIAVSFRYAIPEGTVGEDAYLSMTVNDKEEKVCLRDAESDGNGRYVFKCRVAAAQMTEKIRLQLKDGTGKNIGAEYAYSVRDYAEVLLSRGTEEQKALVRAMLNYGGYAQTLFGYKTDDLANAGIYTDDPVAGEIAEALPEAVAEGEGPVTFDAYNCALESETSMRLYFRTEEGAGPKEYTFLFEGFGEEKELIAQTDEEGRLYVEISGIAVPMIDDMYRIIVQKNGETVLTVQASVACYIRSVLESGEASEAQKNAVKALYFYAKEASGYFES